MNRIPFFLLACIAIFFTVSVLGAQEISEKKEIAIFSLNETGWDIPTGAMGAIDSQIRSVFVNMGRFEVIGFSQKIGQSDVREFIDTIKGVKEKDIEIPEEVLMGQAAFTERDFNKLVGTFIVIIPTVTYFDVQEFEYEDRSKGYTSTIQTEFTIYNVEDDTTVGQFYVETESTQDSRNLAIKESVDRIPFQLEFEVRSIPEFQLKTGIIDIQGGLVYLELGRNMGIMMGDEFAIINSSVSAIGREATSESGMVLIKEVQEDYSVAIPLYSDYPPVVGDQLQEVPRIGVEVTPYINFTSAFWEANQYIIHFGLRATGSRGFFDVRPTVGMEMPFRGTSNLLLALFEFVPLNVYMGAELTNIYMGRLQIAPTLVGGAGGLFPLNEKERSKEGAQFVTHLGGKALLNISYLFSRDSKITGEIGYTYWWGLLPNGGSYSDSDILNFLKSYGGISATVGITLK